VTDVISERPAPAPKPQGRRRADQGTANSAEALDVVATTTNTRGWIALVTMALVVALGVGWAFVGTIPQQIQSQGVLSSRSETFTVVAGYSGAVTVNVSSGQNLAAGATVATVLPFGAPAGTKPTPVKLAVAAQVQDVLVRQGQGVQPSDTIMVVVPSDDNAVDDKVVTYLSADDAANFKVGSTVQVELIDPATSAPAATDATVTAVAQAPSTDEAIIATLKSEQLAKSVLDKGNGAGYRVDLQLNGVAELPSDERPVPGQIVTITNTYARPHPVELLFGDAS
jgi:hypothetical protein